MAARSNACLGRRTAKRIEAAARRLLRRGADPAEMVRTRQRPAQLASTAVGCANVPGLARRAQNANFDESVRGSFGLPSSSGHSLFRDWIAVDPVKHELNVELHAF